MSKVGCPCSAAISDVASPNPNKFWLITDAQREAMELGDIGASHLEATAVFKCSACGRLLVGTHNGVMHYGEAFASYTPEEPTK